MKKIEILEGSITLDTDFIGYDGITYAAKITIWEDGNTTDAKYYDKEKEEWIPTGEEWETTQIIELLNENGWMFL